MWCDGVPGSDPKELVPFNHAGRPVSSVTSLPDDVATGYQGAKWCALSWKNTDRCPPTADI